MGLGDGAAVQKLGQFPGQLLPFTAQSSCGEWHDAGSETPLHLANVGVRVGATVGVGVVGCTLGAAVGPTVATQLVNDPSAARTNPSRHTHVYPLVPTGSEGLHVVDVRLHKSVAASQWCCVGPADGTAVGLDVGSAVVGAEVGFPDVGDGVVGSDVVGGTVDGPAVVGTSVGPTVGRIVGTAVGATVGACVGTPVGWFDGTAVNGEVDVGAPVGNGVGPSVAVHAVSDVPDNRIKPDRHSHV